MKNSSTSYSQAALSFIFKKIRNNDLLKTGSIGVGCTIDKKVKAEVEPGKKFCIFFNGKKIEFPTVSCAVQLITNTPVTINLTSSLPLGYGFGLSGSSAFASILAVNQLLNLNMSRTKLIEVAHIAEIENKTGLGTVGTQTTGGFLVKTSAGIPFDSYSLPFVGQHLFAILIDKLNTSTMLSNTKKLIKVEKEADSALAKIHKLKDPTLADILDISYEFVKDSSLINETRVKDVIEKIRQRNGHATMAIFGNVVITTQKPMFNTPYNMRELIISDNHI